MSGQDTSVLEVNDKGNYNSMTLNSTITNEFNGDCFTVKVHTQDVLSNGSEIPGKSDGGVIEKAQEEKQDANTNSVSVSSGGGDGPQEKSNVTIIPNGLGCDLASKENKDVKNSSTVDNSSGIESTYSDKHSCSSSSVDEAKCLSPVIEPASSLNPSSQSQTTCDNTTAINKDKDDDIHQLSDQGQSETDIVRSSESLATANVEDTEKDGICQLKVQSPTQEMRQLQYEGDECNMELSNGDMNVSLSSPVGKGHEIRSPKSDHDSSPYSVDQTSSCHDIISETNTLESSGDVSSFHSSHSDNKNDSEQQSSKEQSSPSLSFPSNKSSMKDDVSVAVESADIKDVVEYMESANYSEKDTTSLPDAADTKCKKNVKSRIISVLDFNPDSSFSGTSKNSNCISHSPSEDNDTIETLGQVERMEVEDSSSEALDKTETLSCNVNMCTSDLVMSEDVEDGDSGDIEEMEQQHADDSVEKEKDNFHDNLINDSNDSVVQSLSIAAIEGAKTVDSPPLGDQQGDKGDEIQLVSVCSMTEATGVVNKSHSCVDNNDEGVNRVDNVNIPVEDVPLGDGVGEVKDLNANDEDINKGDLDASVCNKDLSLDAGDMDEGDLGTSCDVVVNEYDACVHKDSLDVCNSERKTGCDVSSINHDTADNSNAESSENMDSQRVVAIEDEDSSPDSVDVIAQENGMSKETKPPSGSSICNDATEKEFVQISVDKSSCSGVAEKTTDVSKECPTMELDSESTVSQCDPLAVTTMDTDCENDILVKDKARLSNGSVDEADDSTTAIEEAKEIRKCSKTEDMKDEQKEIEKDIKDEQKENEKDIKDEQKESEELDNKKLENSLCVQTKINDDFKESKIVAEGNNTSSTEKITADMAKKSSFKNILKSSKDEASRIPKETSHSNISGDDDVIIVEENDEDTGTSKSNISLVNEAKENIKNNSCITSSQSGKFLKTTESSRQVDEVARKRLSSNEIGNPSSPKRSRLDSEAPKTRNNSNSNSADDLTVVLMDSDKEDNADCEIGADKLSTTTKKSSPVNNPGITLSSETLRNFIMSSIKAAIWSHKLQKTMELEERMSKMEAASSLWKESGKHLEKSVEELTKFSKEIEKRRLTAQKLKHLSSRSVGVQVTPIAGPDQQRLPQPPTRQSSQQGKQANQPVLSKQSPSSSTSSSTNTQHRLPPSVLLNHNSGGQKPTSVSPSSSTHTANVGRQPIRPHQHQQGVRPPGNPVAYLRSSSLEQNQSRPRFRNQQNISPGTNNQPPPFYNYHQPRPPCVNQSPNSSGRPGGQPRLPSPAVNNSGVIDLTDEDDTTKRPPPPNKTFNNAPLPNNSMNRSNNVQRGGNVFQPQQNQSRPQQSGVNNRTVNLPQQQRYGGNNMATSNSGPRSGYNNASKPGSGPSGITGARLNGVGGVTHQINNAASDSSRAKSSGKASLPPSPSLHSKHPAPFPSENNSVVVPAGAKLLPPMPSLKISRVVKGIVLSWNMPPLNNVATITSYQLYAYQESSGIPSSSAWKKVGDVKALPLPMACTLTQFQEGNKYYFAVRAVDMYGRWGEYSEPSSIYLYPDGATNSGGRES